MKKATLIVVMFICLFCLCGNIFAQDFSKLNEDLLDYKPIKIVLPKENQKSPLGAIILNIYPGLGIGSIIYGDKIGFISQIIIEGIGVGIGIGASIFSYYNPNSFGIPLIVALIGFGFIALGRIYGFIRPFVFKKEQEQKAKNNETNNNETISSEKAIVLPIFSITPEGDIVLGISIEF